MEIKTEPGLETYNARALVILYFSLTKAFFNLRLIVYFFFIDACFRDNPAKMLLEFYNFNDWTYFHTCGIAD